MSGPVSPPLATTETGTTVRVQPTNTLEFNGADFTVTQSGSKASIAIDSTGTGAALTATQVGFGDSSNLMTGSTKLTWNDTATSEQLKVSGTGTSTLVMLESTNAGATQAPDLELFRNSPSPADADYTGAIAFTGYEDTAASSKVTYSRIDTRMFGLDGTESGVLTLYSRQNNALRPQISMKQSGTIINENHEAVFDFVVESNESSAGFHNLYADSGQNNIGLGCVPDSAVERLHVKGTGSSTLVKMESTDAGASAAPDIVLYRNTASPAADDVIGSLQWSTNASDGTEYTAAKIESKVVDTTAGSENSKLQFYGGDQGGNQLVFEINGAADLVVNPDSNGFRDFSVKSANVTNLFCDSSQDNIGMGGNPDSDVERLHIQGTGADPILRITSTDNDADQSPVINLERKPADGTSTSGDELGEISFSGYKFNSGSGTYTIATWARIQASVRHNQGDGSIQFYATRNNGNETEFLRVNGNTECVTVNPENEAFCDFRVDGDTNDNLLRCDVSQENIGVGSAPSSTGAQFQVSEGAQFYRETSNTFTANHDITVEQAHGHVLVMDASSGAANTFTLPDVAAIGMHVKLVNLAGSNGMTVAVAGSTSHQINGAGTAGSSSVSTTTKFQTIECHYVATNVWVATEPAVAA